MHSLQVEMSPQCLTGRLQLGSALVSKFGQDAGHASCAGVSSSARCCPQTRSSPPQYRSILALSLTAAAAIFALVCDSVRHTVDAGRLCFTLASSHFTSAFDWLLMNFARPSTSAFWHSADAARSAADLAMPKSLLPEKNPTAIG